MNDVDHYFETAANRDFPGYVMFDVTNVCNSRCIHCPHSTTFSGHKAKHLEMRIFRRVIDECAEEQVNFIRLTADGEPLLHPDLIDMVRYAASKTNIPIGLTTNGSLLDGKTVEALLDTGIHLFDISLDAATPSTYAAIRRGLDYDKVKGNVENLIRRRNDRGSASKIMVSFVLQAANRHELAEFETIWGDRVDKVLIRQKTSNVNLVQSDTPDDATVERWPCPHLFRRIVVNYDGNMKACPIDWENRTVIGPVLGSTIREAWNGPFYTSNRQAHVNGTIDQESLCRDCRDWQHTPWELGYEKVVKDVTATTQTQKVP